jgi:ubiquinone/menaquinone biosynthesis C-methylase UbiE
MAEAVAPGGTAQGVDPSGEAFAHAQRLTRLANCTFSNGIAEALDAPDGSYDVVATSLMIHHLPEALRAQAIGEMFRVLRPGGSVLIAELRPPASRIGRRLIGGLTGHAAMANNRVDLLEPLVREAGFEQLRSSVVLPRFLYVQALKPSPHGLRPAHPRLHRAAHEARPHQEGSLPLGIGCDRDAHAR